MADIVHRYLRGAISAEEQLALEEWLAEGENHYKILEQYADPTSSAENKRLHELFEINQGYSKFLQGKRCIDRRRRVRRITTIAAIFVGVIALGGGIFLKELFRDNPQLPALSRGTISPGHACATLVLDNGRKVVLSDSLYTYIDQPSGKIDIRGKQLKYHRQDSAGQLIWNKVYTPRGGEYSVALADGTRVWLNAETRLRFPVAFVGKCREVELEGEAYFEVAKDSVKPFIVKTKQMAIRVLGTCFNIKAYTDEPEQTTLVAGSVEASKGSQKRRLLPGEQLTLRGNVLEVRKVDIAAFVAWKDQRFVFDDEVLEDVLRKLERWYDVEFFIRNASVRELRFTGNLPKYENLDNVLKKLELATRIRFVQKNRVVIVESDE